MNGFTLMANSYKQLLEREEFTPEEREDFERHIKIFNFLGTCSDEDFYILFDSAAFNDIVKCYCKKLADNYTKSHNITGNDAEDFEQDILNEINALFSEMTARDAHNYVYKR